MKWSLASMIMLSILTFALTACSGSDGDVVQGYVEGELVYISSSQSGTLMDLLVHRGQAVKAGTQLFKLDPQPESDEVQQAQATLEQAQATLKDVKLGKRPDEIDEIKAQIEATDAAIKFYAKEEQRYAKLAKQSYASQEKYDENKYKYDMGVAKKKELEASLNLAYKGSRENQIKAQEQVVAADQAALEQAQWSQQQKSSKATLDGIIFDTYYKPDEWVAAGQPIASILSPKNIRIIFFVPETQLANISVGQTVNFACDGCKNPTQATISYISSENEYTPPVIYSNDMRTKLVYEVKATIPVDEAMAYHPGQPVDVTLPEGK